MAQEKGRYGSGGRGDYGADDPRRERQSAGFGSGRFPGEQGHGQQGGSDFSPGQQEGRAWRDPDDDRQRQYGSDDRSRDEPSSFPGPGGFGPAYGGDHPRGSQGRFGERYGGDRSYGDRRRSEGGRDFWDKATDEVSSWFGDEDAERRRRQDHRGRGPKGYARSDERIKEDVNDRLTDDWSLDASDIEVIVVEREVTLTGEVSSRADKRRAEDVAEAVSGVSHVQNNLRVKQAST